MRSGGSLCCYRLQTSLIPRPFRGLTRRVLLCSSLAEDRRFGGGPVPLDLANAGPRRAVYRWTDGLSQSAGRGWTSRKTRSRRPPELRVAVRFEGGQLQWRRSLPSPACLSPDDHDVFSSVPGGAAVGD